jgi:hypothetical protein
MKRLPSNDYDFFTVWRVPGTVDEVTAILADAASLPVWWPSVYLSVIPVPPFVDDKRKSDGEAGAEGDGDGDGRNPTGTGTGIRQSFRLHTKGWLPYTLQWTMTPDGPITPEGFSLTAAGDLTGTGRWTFLQDGPETVVTYRWQVSAGKPLLRRLGWLLKPLFSANHRWAMERGEESLTLELRRRRHAQAGTADDVPPPPAATFRLNGLRRFKGAQNRNSQPR